MNPRIDKAALSAGGEPGAKPEPGGGARLATRALPPPRVGGGLPLMQALQRRRSQRAFASQALPEPVLADLLWAACGVNRPQSDGRTAPRALALQAIDVYVALPAGLCLYDPAGHRLHLTVPRDLRALTGNQDFPAVAALDLVFVADHRAVPWVQAEQCQAYAWVAAGAMAQNVYLCCASMGLASVLRAWVDREALSAAMALRPGQQVLLAQSVGYPEPGICGDDRP